MWKAGEIAGLPGRKTSLILGENKLRERKFGVNKFKYLAADLVHGDVEDLANSL